MGKRHNMIYILLKADTQQTQLTFDLLDLEFLTATGKATKG